EAVDALDLSGRVTMASMATEMGGIIALFTPNEEVLSQFEGGVEAIVADADAHYEQEFVVDVDGAGPMLSRPGHPEDVVPVADLLGTRIDSAFIGSCTNGRYADLEAAAQILKGRTVAPGVVLKVVPSTDDVWKRCLEKGLIDVFKKAGALIGNAGCAGCAAGQIGQNGPGEVTISTGNRNFAGKQGKGEVYLASPALVAASAVAGVIAVPEDIPAPTPRPAPEPTTTAAPASDADAGPTTVRGRVWVIDRENIDTDMIFHNRYLAITEVAEMGQYAFDNLEGREDFATKVRPGDIVITGGNFGCGSSRQQAVDCFASLGVSLLVAKSFGAIYERNAINSGFPILAADLTRAGLSDGDEIEVDLETGRVTLPGGETLEVAPFSDVQLEIYRRGGLLR
ncbi:MAG: aconitase family protein, partial [Planctomycetota bacterium]